MTDRDRLIKLLSIAVGDCNLTDPEIKIVANYLIANGIIVPPCEVGDTVYALYNGKVLKANIFSMKIETEDDKYVYMLKLKIFDHFFQFKTFLLGKTVFLTREEAEKALEGYKENSEKESKV